MESLIPYPFLYTFLGRQGRESLGSSLIEIFWDLIAKNNNNNNNNGNNNSNDDDDDDDDDDTVKTKCN